MSENYFKELYSLDFSEKIKEKNGLNYVPWAVAWAEVKKKHPTATYHIYEREDPNGLIYNYFTDGKTCWVKAGVTINGIEHIENLACIDFRNKSIPLDSITSIEVNKSIQRCLTKACARHGVGLHVYEGEEFPEEIKNIANLQQECMSLIKKRSALSEKTKDKVAEICMKADEEANGDPRLINDTEKLETLKKALLSLRKIV